MTDGGDGLKQALGEELTKLTKEEKRLDQEREAIISQLAIIRRRKDLVKALLGTDEMASSETAGSAEDIPGTTVLIGGMPTANGRSVADIAYEILSKRGKEPLHYQELTDLVRAAGADLGGPNPAQTLVARIAKDERFVRPAKRGWYSLREFYPRTKNVGARKKKSASGRKTTVRSKQQ